MKGWFQASVILALGVLLSLSGGGLSFGQEPFFSVTAISAQVNQATLQTFYQDRQGFFWLGTSKGLYRYDGNNYVQIQTVDSLKDESFTAIFEDSGHTLWAGTRSGAILSVTRGVPARFNPEEGVPSAPITGIAEDSLGQIWFATYGEGVYCWNGRRMYNLDAGDGLGDNFTYTIIKDHRGNLWVGTDGGISICSFLKEKKTVKNLNTSNGLPDNIVVSLAKGPGTGMWAGMQAGGLCRIDAVSHTIEVPAGMANFANGPVNELVVTESRIWAASEEQGILSAGLLPPFTSRKFNKIPGMAYFKIRQILCDDQQNIWFLTSNAMIRTTGDKLEFLSSASHKGFSNIKSIMAAKDGTLWFSNETGLFRFRPAAGTSPELCIPGRNHPGVQIVSLYEDWEGFIWAGTFGDGVYRYDPDNRGLQRFTEADGLANNNILSIDGTDREIWFATLGGVTCCRLPEGQKSGKSKMIFEKFGEKHGLGSNFIYSVFVDSKRRVWFATDGTGITVYENGRFTNYEKEAGEGSQIVYSIAQEKNGHIWFSSSGAGLFHFDGKDFRNFTRRDGLTDLAITGLTAAASPVIFIVHPAGIDVLDPVQEKFSYLGVEDGIGEISSNINAVAADTINDLVWVGTDKGIIKLSASAFRKPMRPLIRLSSVKVFLGETDTLQPHKFAHDRNHFTFDFVGLWYKAPDRVQYQVMLEGYDLDWIPTRNGSVVYSSLAPGDYTFKVRASLNNDFSDAAIAHYHFVIRKPFWATYWFMALALVMAVAIVYLVVRERESKLRRRENLQREKLLFQLQTLKNQVNPHFLFNSFSTLSAIIDEDRDMALDYVQKLSAFFRNILEYRDKSVITLREELTLADTYYYLQKKRYGANFNLVTDIPAEYLNTLIPPMTLQMIIENAVKHNVISTDKPLTVLLSAVGPNIVITNAIQAKKSETTSTGVGLQNIMNRYRLLVDREVGINRDNGVFTVSLPVIQSIPS